MRRWSGHGWFTPPPLLSRASRAAPPCEKVFRLAHEQGKIVSLDPNYSARIWPHHKEARQVLSEMYKYVNITKPSLDDAGRIFGREFGPEQYIEMFHEMGPRTVILTMGEEGILISEDGHLVGHVPARPVEVHDATGAGDSFWAGFLVALIDGEPLERCALFARELAELKLTRTGPLPTGDRPRPTLRQNGRVVRRLRTRQESRTTSGAEVTYTRRPRRGSRYARSLHKPAGQLRRSEQLPGGPPGLRRPTRLRPGARERTGQDGTRSRHRNPPHHRPRLAGVLRRDRLLPRSSQRPHPAYLLRTRRVPPQRRAVALPRRVDGGRGVAIPERGAAGRTSGPGTMADGGLAAALLAEVSGAPFTFTGHSLGAWKLDPLLNDSGDPDTLARADQSYNFGARIQAERAAMARSAVIVTNSAAERSEQYATHPAYLDLAGSRETKNDSPRYRPASTWRSSLPKPEARGKMKCERRYGIRTSETSTPERRDLPAVIAWSRLDPKKNHLALVEAFASSPELRQKANLVMITRGLEDPLRDPGSAPEEQSRGAARPDLRDGSLVALGQRLGLQPVGPDQPRGALPLGRRDREASSACPPSTSLSG